MTLEVELDRKILIGILKVVLQSCTWQGYVLGHFVTDGFGNFIRLMKVVRMSLNNNTTSCNNLKGFYFVI